MARRWVSLLGAIGGLAASSVSANTFHVGSGADVDLGTAQVDLGCADVEVGGTLDADASTVVQGRHVSIAPGGLLQGGSSHLSLTGDWSNEGTFVSGTSSIAVVDGCGTLSTTISGASTFFALEVTSAQGRSLLLESGSTQTVRGALTLEGSSGALLPIQSTTPGLAAQVDLQGGAQQIVSVQVQDVHAIGDPLLADPSSTLLGNTPGWGILSPAVPGLSWRTALLLAGGLLGVGGLGLRPRGAARIARRFPAAPSGRAGVAAPDGPGVREGWSRRADSNR